MAGAAAAAAATTGAVTGAGAAVAAAAAAAAAAAGAVIGAGAAFRAPDSARWMSRMDESASAAVIWEQVKPNSSSSLVIERLRSPEAAFDAASVWRRTLLRRGMVRRLWIQV